VAGASRCGADAEVTVRVPDPRTREFSPSFAEAATASAPAAEAETPGTQQLLLNNVVPIA